MHTSLAASHFTCLRNLKLETALEPGNLLAELFESSFQFLAFRILGQRIHARSAYRGLRDFLATSNPEPNSCQNLTDRSGWGTAHKFF